MVIPPHMNLLSNIWREARGRDPGNTRKFAESLFKPNEISVKQIR